MAKYYNAKYNKKVANTRYYNHNLSFFTEAALIAAWELWKMWNDKVFKRNSPTPASWPSNFKNQCYLQSVRFKDDLRSSFCFWLDAFS